MSAIRVSRVPWPSGVALAVSGGGVLGMGLLAALVIRDPHRPGSWGSCPILAATGLPCPTCGGLRATHDVLTGQWARAFAENAYLAGSELAVVLVVAGVLLWRRWRSRSPGRAGRGLVAAAGGFLSAAVPILWALGLLSFGVIRALRLAS